MKNITIKIALVAALLASITPIAAMGRFTGQFGKVIQQKTIQAFKGAQQKATKMFDGSAQQRVTKEDIKTLNESTFEAASTFSSGKKKYAESFLFDILHKRVKQGGVPTFKDIRELDQYSWKANHGVLNLAGEGGHTLLYYALHLPESRGRSNLLKALYDRGAVLNVRDKNVMGPEKRLKALLNLPLEASAWTTVKVYRTLLTKNTEKKLSRFNEVYKQNRLNKVEQAQKEYAEIESDLLKMRKEDQKKKYFKLEELV